MLFNSYGFIFLFLPLVLAVISILPPRFRLAWILVCSYVFYALVGQAWFLLPMLFTSVLDFLLAKWMQELPGLRRRAVLILSLSLNFGLLAVFKYSVFAGAVAQSLGSN